MPPVVNSESTHLYRNLDEHPTVTMQRMIDISTARGTQLAASGEGDCLGQPLLAILCGPLCFPCAVVRLTGHYTGKFDPSDYIGLDSCIKKERRYEDLTYDESPRIGNGCSKKCLDIMSVLATISLAIGLPLAIINQESVAATTIAPLALPDPLAGSILPPPTNPFFTPLLPNKMV